MTSMQFVSLGRLDYDSALAQQLARVDALFHGQDDRQTVFTVEHGPTITIGRNGTADHIVADDEFLQRQGFIVRHVDRGGDVTYHGPGQLVVYPVLHLGPWENDVSAYVRRLEEVVIRALAEEAIVATRHPDFPGVWVNDAKICAVGARVKRCPTGEFVTYHGIALNVHTDMSHFQTIVPCGIVDKGVTSVARELGRPAGIEEWTTRLIGQFLSVFESTH